MREKAHRVKVAAERVLDTCGTGGDHSGTLNLSTGAALIAAAAGVPVAKHGNRAASSKAGSADVLESLGLPLDVPAAAQASILREVGIVFLFAQAHHPAMRHAGPVRKDLGIRTVFNCLGPLANPARATHHLLGAFDDAMRAPLARALSSLGTRRAWVVRGVDGLDEVSPYGPTRVTQVERGAVEELEISPEDFGLARLAPGAATGGEPADNARALEAVLRGQPHPATDAFLLNAAAALVVAEGITPKQATERAREVVANGRAWKTFERWREQAVRARAASSK
jgi:anthranilate phosphoribosyltransferase